MSIYDYMFTYGGPQLFVLFVVFVLTPLVYRFFLKQRIWRARIVSVVALWIAAVFVAYGDVFLIAREAQRLCGEEAGMRVYRTVETNGIIGPLDIREWEGKGIEYIEWGSQKHKQYFRERMVNGQYVKERVPSFISRYEVVRQEVALRLPIVWERESIVERETGQVLSEIISFSFYPGWLDSRLLGLVGFTWTPPRCDDNHVPEQGVIHHFTSELVGMTVNRHF